MKDLAQDAAEDVLGAAEDGRVIGVLIVESIVVFQRRNAHAQHTRAATPHAPLRGDT